MVWFYCLECFLQMVLQLKSCFLANIVHCLVSAISSSLPTECRCCSVGGNGGTGGHCHAGKPLDLQGSQIPSGNGGEVFVAFGS